MLLVTLLVVGTIANQRVPLMLFPGGFLSGAISVRFLVTGLTPQEVMERISIPAEELIRTVPGVTRIRSWSASTSSILRVEYGNSEDTDVIYADIRDRMERLLPSLPEGADQYELFRFDLDDLPVMSVAASYPESVNAPDSLLESVVGPRLEAVDGVARVEIQGLAKRQVAVELIPELVFAHGVDVRDLISRLRGENILAPGGTIDDGGRRSLLRVSNRFTDLEAVRAVRIDDSLTLGEIAEIKIERGLDRWLVRVDGRPCKILSISKESDANAVDVCARVHEVFDEVLPQDPRLQDFRFEVYFDTGQMIVQSLNSLKRTCAWGGVLAIVVLFAFLRRWRSTLLVSASIPLSLLISIVVIYFSGGTLNVFSMMGLTIGIGMLIDNAIVVSENIFRKSGADVSPRAAARLGASEVALAVTLATLTTVAVFVPLIFLGSASNIRLVMTELGLPVCYSLIGSLFVALIFIPSGAARLPKGSSVLGDRGGRRLGIIDGLYRRAVVLSLRHRLPTLVVFLAVIASTAIPQQLIGNVGEQARPLSNHSVGVEFPHGISLIEADRLVHKIIQACEPHREPLQIHTIATWFNADRGTLAFFLQPGVTETREGFLGHLRAKLPELPGVDYELGGDAEEDRGGLRIDATGRDPELLNPIIQRLAQRIRELDGVFEVSIPADGTREEISLVLERESAERFSVSAQQVSTMVSWMLRGAPLPDFELDGEDLPMWIRFKEQESEGLGELSRVEILTDSGAVPLANVANVQLGRTLPRIRRDNRQVTSRIAVSFAEDADQVETEARVRAVINAIDLPDGYFIGVDGGMSRFREDLSDVFSAGLLGLVLIFILMGVLFESFLMPLSILCTVPFLFVGAYWSIAIFGVSLADTALIGFIILMGIVVNNAIVLVDCINRYRRNGLRRSEAILEAAQARMRPIWMTALTTMCGLLPMVLTQYNGAGVNYRPLGVVVLGGLASSTVFTLLAVPIFYSLLDDLREWPTRLGIRSRAGEDVETSETE